MARIGEMLGWGGNPLYQTLGLNRNALMQFGAGLASGQDFGQGVANGLYGLSRGAQVDQQAAMDAEAKAQEQQSKNATLEWLRSNGYNDLLAGVESGGLDIGTAWGEALKRGQPGEAPKPIEINGQLVDPNTYEVLGDFRDQPAGPDQKELFGFEKDLAAQYGGQDPVKTYQAVRNGYERVRASAQTESGPGDVSMIFAYMKMLDPTSVVREGEFATAENAGGVGQQVSNIYNRLLNGERLTPELRKQFLAAADKLYAETSSNLSDLNTQYTNRATAWGVEPSRFMTTPETYQPLSGSDMRTTSNGTNWSF